MSIYGYIRVSTLKQVDEGQSLEVQDRTIHGYAMMLGLKIDRVFTERGVSGSISLEDRPEGSKLLSALKKGDIIITPKLDRMFRSALDALDILKFVKEQEAQLHMLDLGGDVTGNGISKLVFTILSAVAEAERDRTTERIREVKAAQKLKGQFLGGKLPYGFRIDSDNGNTLVPDERQQGKIKLIVQYHREGHSLRAIQVLLDNRAAHEHFQAGTLDSKPKPPSLVTISRIIKEQLGQTESSAAPTLGDKDDD
jgi:putative DNA-invertase from lambdoid prophage Rac